MATLQEYMNDYKQQLDKGSIQKAYQGLMEYFGTLRAYFNKKYPSYSVPGNIYYGFMDMTYFAVIPEYLKQRKLKLAIVFVHDTFRFEVWLSGVNRDVQERYWKLIKDSGWDKYHLTANPRRDDSILDHVLISDPHFNDLEALTAQIEKGVLEFNTEIEKLMRDLPIS